MDGRWSALDTSKGARTIQEIKNSLKLPKSKRFGCQNVPIFDFVPIDRVIIDTLHLFLRVSDLLTNLLIQDLRRLDGIAKACLDRQQHSNVVAYEKFLNEVCKINFSWYIDKESKQMQWRDLSGPEKIRLFKNIDIPKYFPALAHAPILQDEFWRIFSVLNDPVCPSEVCEDVKNWVTRRKISHHIYIALHFTFRSLWRSTEVLSNSLSRGSKS